MSEKTLKPIIESFNEEEEFLYNKHYLFIKGYATGKGLHNTLLALPLARKIHNGQYRKGNFEINGKSYQLPYILHCLKVCSTIISLSLPLTTEEEDMLLAASILHDVIEDGSEYFPKGGIELALDYGLNKEIFDIIKLLSKHSGANEYELNEYFNNIKTNKYALIIKLADRSHNVEDLYNMKNIHKYVIETRNYVYKLAGYAKTNYPELSNGVTILKSKIVSLTELTEVLIEQHEEELKNKDDKIAQLEALIQKLKKGM